MTKRNVEKDPVKLMKIADEAASMKRALSPADYQTWKAKQPFFWHEARPSCVVKDKDTRLMGFFALPAARKYVHLLPRTGWGTLRELSKLGGSDDLEALILCGAISPTTTRKEVDNLRSAQKLSCSMKPVRLRHMRV